MVIVVTGGTVTKGRNYVQKDKQGRIVKAVTRSGKTSTTMKSSKSESSNLPKTNTYKDETGRTLTPFESAVVEKKSAPMTSAKTGETVYTSVNVERASKPSSSASNNRNVNINNLKKDDFISAGEMKRQKDLSTGSSGGSSFEISGYNMTSDETGFSSKSGRSTSQIVSTINMNREEAYSKKLFQKNSEGKIVINFDRVGKSPISKFGEGFAEVYNTGYVSPDSTKSGTFFKELGGATAVAIPSTRVLNVAGQAYQGVVSPVVQGYTTLLTKLPYKTGVVTNLVVSGATTYGLSKGVSKVGTGLLSVTSPETKTFIQSGQARGAYEAGIAAEQQGAGFIKRQALNIPIVNKVVKRDDAAYTVGVSNYAREQGVTNVQGLLKSSRQVENVQTASFASGLLSANTFSEIGGGVALTKIKPSSSKFVTGFKAISNQGFIEGTSSVIAEQASSGKNLKNLNYGAVAAGGVLGAGTAGVVGGLIYASPKPVSNLLLGASYLSDPFEAVGDYTAKSSARVLTGTVSTTNRGGRGRSTNSLTSTNTISASTPVSSSVNVNSNSFTMVRTPTPSISETSTFVNAPTPVSTNIRSNIFTRVNTPSNVFSPVNTNVQTPVNVPVNVNTPTNVFTSTPTTVYGKALLPPLLGGLGGSNARFKSGFGDFFKQSRSYNPSLSASVLGITGMKPSSYGIKTGLVIRPL